MNLNLEGKSVLITGSTAGIGKGIAQSFVKAASIVIVNGRNQDTINKVIDELKKDIPTNSNSTQIHGIAADAGTAEGCEKILKETKEILKGGTLDVLVCNLGIFGAKDFKDADDELWLQYFNSNIMSSVRLCRSILPEMLTRNSGRIVVISSETGQRPIPYMIHYSVTKAAQISLARGMAELTKGTNVTVNSVLVGPTWTEGVEAYCEGLGKHQNKTKEQVVEEYFKIQEPTSLISRFLKVEEVANVVLFLSSSAASGINGTAQRVEGGILRYM